jgi:hypothetical protein
MKTCVHLWLYIAELFLELQMFQIKIVEEMKSHILCPVSFFPQKSRRLWDNVEKYGRTGQATECNIIRRMRFARWITKTAIHTGNMQYLLLFHGNRGYTNAPQFYV